MSAIIHSENGFYLTRSQIEQRRKMMDADVWLFIKWVCGHGADDLARFHRPMAYMLAGDAPRLAACLNTYESEIVTQIKADLARNNIDWNTKAGILALGNRLKRINERISRSMGKTVISKDVDLALGSRDPNIRIGIASKSDPAAWAMCTTIGNTMKSDLYEMYYSDRLFRRAGGSGYDLDSFITNKWIRMNGRTVAEQETIEARGVNSQWYSKHYHVIDCDDLASTEAKQGEATVEDAIRFIASLHGISISERWGGTRYLFSGTIQGPSDDHAKLSSNPEYMSIVVPIWKREAPATLSNVKSDGVPVLPELYDLEAIKRMRADTLANDALGAVSWLQNFELTAHNAGSMQFTAELLNRQKFTWITRRLSDGTSTRSVRRYLFNEDWSPKREEKFAKINTEPCRCYQACGHADHAFIEFSPLDAPRMLAVDQAISSKGDQWGVGASTIDAFGHCYQLKGEYDRGYWKMVPAVAKVFRRWGGSPNPPRKIGMESNTWQAVSADWMKRDPELQFLAHRIEKLPPATTQKVMRILRDIHANLEMGTLWLDPDDHIFEQCALQYNAAEPDSQWDDPLDCVAMAVQLHRHPATIETAAQRRKAIVEEEMAYVRDYDDATGVDLSTDFTEVM